MKYPQYLKGNFLVGVIVIAAILSLVWILVLPKYTQHKQGSHVLASNTAANLTTLSASQSANTNPSPSPSPEVLTGYCLNVPILIYHRIQPQSIAQQQSQTALSVDSGTFESQMAYLNSKGYVTISTAQLAQALISHGKVPSKSVVVTIDDGYDNFYNFALPIIQKYHIHVDLLIPTGLLNNPQYMTWDQLKAAISSGLVGIVNHTHSHANLGAADAAKISFEVLTAKKQLAEIGQNPIIFGYPYGTVAGIKFLQDNGFIAALSTIPGQTQCDSFLMSLHRTRVGNSSLAAYGL